MNLFHSCTTATPIRGHASNVLAVEQAVLRMHERSGLSHIHGPQHWARVAIHAARLSQSEGVDPLVPHVFALVHDSHRHDDGTDFLHGQRAAHWVRSERNGLFAFLSSDQLHLLAHACRDHSRGLTLAPATVMVCWDADRLDLGRDGVFLRPDPRRLCTDTAKRAETIAQACLLNGLDEADVCADEDEQADPGPAPAFAPGR